MKTTKYRSVKTVVDGITFDSKKEAKRYGELKLLKMAGEIKDFVLQPDFQYSVTYEHPSNGISFSVMRRYYADFKVINNDATEVIEDVKGLRTETYKQKKKIVEKLYGIKIVEL